MLLNHELSIPWRETKFEQAANFSGALKGLFLHTELIQPRRAAPGLGHNDAQSPNPPFTAAQYDRLALLYVIASVRANRWLIPAYHAALDADIRNGHDDPLNFDPESFASSIAKLVDTLNAPEAMRLAASAPANDAKRPPDPPFSPLSLIDPAELPPPRAVAASEPSAQPPPDAPAQAKDKQRDKDGAAPAKAESGKGEDRKTSDDRKIVAEHCQTYFFKGRRHSVCRPYVAAVPQTARPADRRVLSQNTATRYRAGNQNARHLPGKFRPGRA
jgi:hypothetical protein